MGLNPSFKWNTRQLQVIYIYFFSSLFFILQKATNCNWPIYFFVLFCFCFEFLDHNQQCSGYSWLCAQALLWADWGNHMGYRGLNLGRPCTNQEPPPPQFTIALAPYFYGNAFLNCTDYYHKLHISKSRSKVYLGGRKPSVTQEGSTLCSVSLCVGSNHMQGSCPYLYHVS